MKVSVQTSIVAISLSACAQLVSSASEVRELESEEVGVECTRIGIVYSSRGDSPNDARAQMREFVYKNGGDTVVYVRIFVRESSEIGEPIIYEATGLPYNCGIRVVDDNTVISTPVYRDVIQ